MAQRSPVPPSQDLSNRPLPTSQIRTVLSQPAEASVFPSLPNDNPYIGPACPASGNFWARVLAFQSRTILSLPAVASVSPSGEMATAYMAPGCSAVASGLVLPGDQTCSPPLRSPANSS